MRSSGPLGGLPKGDWGHRPVKKVGAWDRSEQPELRTLAWQGAGEQQRQRYRDRWALHTVVTKQRKPQTQSGVPGSHSISLC